MGDLAVQRPVGKPILGDGPPLPAEGDVIEAVEATTHPQVVEGAPPIDAYAPGRALPQVVVVFKGGLDVRPNPRRPRVGQICFVRSKIGRCRGSTHTAL